MDDFDDAFKVDTPKEESQHPRNSSELSDPLADMLGESDAGSKQVPGSSDSIRSDKSASMVAIELDTRYKSAIAERDEIAAAKAQEIEEGANEFRKERKEALIKLIEERKATIVREEKAFYDRMKPADKKGKWGRIKEIGGVSENRDEGTSRQREVFQSLK
ncbi:hypothetical protein ADUPG1_013073 [Aduncisulcus paluster]|uniref:Clathrin light chain n=1 Tax=Aduncisulcus paluster TaxID=2918883 RepID=A0ABQ5K1N7_9EUKA|nr:hypothetical protein ADUPG1_013073 [Aduncisulcus paluster]